MLDQIKAWFKNSLTILWARIVALSGVVLAAFVNLASDPNSTSVIQQALQPKYLPYWIIGIGIVTEVARRRTVGKATDETNQVVP